MLEHIVPFKQQQSNVLPQTVIRASVVAIRLPAGNPEPDRSDHTHSSNSITSSFSASRRPPVGLGRRSLLFW